MQEFEKENNKQQYKSQGLGGYEEEEEESLDNSGKFDL